MFTEETSIDYDVTTRSQHYSQHPAAILDTPYR
jgi:hypothetical protein